MNDFKEKILQGIKTGEIKAESKWRFLAHDYFFWLLTGISAILGALAIASILHRITIDQMPLAQHARHLDSIPVFIQTLPYLWLLVLLVLAAAAWFNFNKTSKAYKHQAIVLLSMVIVSMVLGGALFAIGVGGKVDKQVRDRVPAFEKQRMIRQGIRNNYLQQRETKSPRVQERQLRPYPVAPQERVR